MLKYILQVSPNNQSELYKESWGEADKKES